MSLARRVLCSLSGALLMAAAAGPWPALAASPYLEGAVETVVLATSTAEVEPADGPLVVVGKEGITVGLPGNPSKLVLTFETDADGQLAIPEDHLRGQLVRPLHRELQYLRRSQELVHRLLYNVDPSAHRLAVVVEADVPFRLLRAVIYTAGQARFGTFALVVHNPWLDAPRVIETALPAIGPPGELELQPPPEEPPLTLAVTVTSQGLTLLGASEILGEVEGDDAGEPVPQVPCPAGGCAGPDDYDWASFHSLLGMVKDAHPEEHVVIVVPEADVSHEVIVRVLDVARWAPVAPGFDADLEAVGAWQADRSPLFQAPVIAGGMQ